jgi:hypothetical protein
LIEKGTFMTPEKQEIRRLTARMNAAERRRMLNRLLTYATALKEISREYDKATPEPPSRLDWN